MDWKHLTVGAGVRVALPHEATFEPVGHYKNQDAKPKMAIVTEGDRILPAPPGWVDAWPRPWYPHGKEVAIHEVVEQFFVRVIDDDGRVWGNKIGCWAIESLTQAVTSDK
jgi:hypothetical protein